MVDNFVKCATSRKFKIMNTMFQKVERREKMAVEKHKRCNENRN